MAGFTGASPIVTDGLVFVLDAANHNSYPGSGTTWYDLSGNGYDSILANSPTFDKTNSGRVILDGIDAHAYIPYSSYWDNNVFGNATNFTISCWVKCNNFYNWTSVIHKSNGGYYSQSEGASIWVNVSGFQGVFGNGISGNSGDWGKILSYSTSNTTDWFNLTFTGDGTTLRFYVNGTQEVSTSQSSRTAGLNITTNPVRFGRRYSSSDFNGNIANVKLYTRALSATEISQNYNSLKSRFNL